MNEQYISAMDGLVLKESAKQAIISKIKIQRDKAAKAKQKRIFNWNKKWTAVTACACVAIIFCSVFFPMMMFGKKGGSKETFLYDYYREYKFELPFKFSDATRTNALYFDTELTIEQMTEQLQGAGYEASLYAFDNVKKIFITVAQNGFLHYFTIYDKNLFSNGSKYILSQLSANILKDESWQADKNIFVFLFPLHLSDLKTGFNNIRNIYCTFDEFVQFYEATGKDDVTIDKANKTVTFFCEGSTPTPEGDANWARGNIIMQYQQVESGNQIIIRPQLGVE